MSGPHYISASNCEATGHAAAGYLSPGNVAAYRAAILGAGYVLGGLLSCVFLQQSYSTALPDVGYNKRKALGGAMQLLTCVVAAG